MKNEIKRICCIGAGYVGGPTMAVIADKCPHIHVEVVDINEQRINKWNTDQFDELPVYEPGLADIVKRCRGLNLNFSSLIEENIKKADMIFISVNTPTKKRGVGAGKASDLKWVEACAREVSKHAQGHTIVVEKSTLPVRTAEIIQVILKESNFPNQNDSKKTFDVLSNPEFLAEGSAINDLLNPDRVLIGGSSDIAIESLSTIYQNWIPKGKIIKTNLWSSELAKLTANAFLAQRISSINSVSALCEETGADIKEVANAIGSDQRIGSKFLNAGPGFGGSCFQKDILNLVYLSEFYGLNEVATFWNEVLNLNNWQKNRISKLITKKLFGTLAEKKIAVLGFAFKSNTNDTRESAAIQICKDLIEEGAFLAIHDPKVDQKQIEYDLNISQKNNKGSKSNANKNSTEGNWISTKSILDALTQADAAVILTEWQEYSKINWIEASQKMRSPAWIFDSRSITCKEDIINSGLNFWRIGDGTV